MQLVQGLNGLAFPNHRVCNHFPHICGPPMNSLLIVKVMVN
jgi:hypothetical protein